MNPKKKKDQFVIAYLSCEAAIASVTEHSIALARILHKDVVLLYVDDSRYRKDNISEERLQQLQEQLNNKSIRSDEIPSPHVGYCILRQPTRKAIAAIGELLNGVIAVAAVDPAATRKNALHPREVLRNFALCKTAYLTVQIGSANANKACYDRVAFSVDYSKESKEKLLWASYFARFNSSSLELYYHTYRDEGLRQKWYNNMRFLDKFFNSLGLRYRRHELAAERILHAETRVVSTAASDGCHLLVSTTTDLRNKDLLDYLLGTAEQKVVRNSDKLPVLFINPRDDLYVLCD